MNTFKQYCLEKCWKHYKQVGMKKKGKKMVPNCVKRENVVLGIDETIEIDGIGSLLAKVDTGNEAYNVLHGINIEDTGNNVTFVTAGNKQITKPKKNNIKIHIGSGVKEDRPVVLFNVRVNGQEYRDVPFSIADRTENEEPVLIGAPFLKTLDAVVDTTK
jgi:hypothetical protein